MVTFLVIENLVWRLLLLRELMKRLPMDIKVYEVTGGRKAIKKVDEGLAPDVIVLDTEYTGFGNLASISILNHYKHLTGVPMVVITPSVPHQALRGEWMLEGCRFHEKPSDLDGYERILLEALGLALEHQCPPEPSRG